MVTQHCKHRGNWLLAMHTKQLTSCHSAALYEANEKASEKARCHFLLFVQIRAILQVCCWTLFELICFSALFGKQNVRIRVVLDRHFILLRIQTVDSVRKEKSAWLRQSAVHAKWYMKNWSYQGDAFSEGSLSICTPLGSQLSPHPTPLQSLCSHPSSAARGRRGWQWG